MDDSVNGKYSETCCSRLMSKQYNNGSIMSWLYGDIIKNMTDKNHKAFEAEASRYVS